MKGTEPELGFSTKRYDQHPSPRSLQLRLEEIIQ
jgi:hypothetical protein